MCVCLCAPAQPRYLKHSSNSVQKINIAFEMRKCSVLFQHSTLTHEESAMECTYKLMLAIAYSKTLPSFYVIHDQRVIPVQTSCNLSEIFGKTLIKVSYNVN